MNDIKLKAERTSDGKWVVSDKRGHLVPMIEVFKVLVCPECSSSNIEVIDDTGDEESYPLDTPVDADNAAKFSKLFAASPDLKELLEELATHVIKGDKLQAVAVATVALDTLKGLKE